VTSYGVAEGQRYWRVSDHRLKAELIIRGDGWGSVPSALVAKELQAGTLRAVSHLGLRERSMQSVALYRRGGEPHGPVASFLWSKAETIRI
jgi:DNA-binding transcriptional LysR family regulator